MADDDVTLGELYRSIADLKGELRDLKSGFVPRGEYNEGQKRHGERLGNLEKELTGVRATLAGVNKMAWGAVVMGIVVPIILAILVTNLGLK